MTKEEQLEQESPPCTNMVTVTPSVRVTTIVLTGRARLPGFRVGFRAQNPGLLHLRLAGFGLFQASGFFGLFWSFEKMTIFTSFKMTHIEAKSINICLRYDIYQYLARLLTKMGHNII